MVMNLFLRVKFGDSLFLRVMRDDGSIFKCYVW